MYLLLTFVFVVSVCGMVYGEETLCSTNCLVEVMPYGKIQGKYSNGMCSYTNIPYAVPPILTNRFEAPIPYTDTWTGIRDGTQAAVACTQFSQSIVKPGATENCLVVNIYVPCTCEDSFPVRAYLHGGGFMFGGAGDSNPIRLVKAGILVVQIGYRLGPLGFLSTGDKCIPGNNGLKDQREALRWIKRNIEYFKGNPKKVLLSGSSAGGASSHLHYLRKEKLFAAVMANNGVAFNPWAFQSNPSQQFAKFVGLLNCSGSCAAIKSCIKSKSVQSIMDATQGMKVYGDVPFNTFGYVLENPKDQDAFITQEPEVTIRTGKASTVPLLIAHTNREGSYTAAELLAIGADGSAKIKELNSKWLEYAPHMLFYNNTMPAESLNQRSNELRQQYLGDKSFSEENYRLLENMFTDVLYLNGVTKAICLHRKYNTGKLYVYEYKYPHKYGIGNLLAHRTDIAFHADHGADGIFTIPLNPLYSETLTENEQKITSRLCELYKSLINGRAMYDNVELPLNTPWSSGKLVINEFCHSLEFCSNSSCFDCSKYE